MAASPGQPTATLTNDRCDKRPRAGSLASRASPPPKPPATGAGGGEGGLLGAAQRADGLEHAGAGVVRGAGDGRGQTAARGAQLGRAEVPQGLAMEGELLGHTHGVLLRRVNFFVDRRGSHAWVPLYLLK